MREWVINFLESIIEYIKKSENETKNIDVNYKPLSPINNVKEITYSDALEWAISTRKENNIRNIALTGPYGSGKSSVINTFQERNKESDLKFLKISLATFKEEDIDEGVDDKVNPDNTDKTEDGSNTKGTSKPKKRQEKDTLRLLELSILQQIIYHVKAEELPDSNLKRITIFSKRSLNYHTIFSIIFIISTAQLMAVKFNSFLLKSTFISDGLAKAFHYISIAVFLVLSFFIIKKLIILVKSFKTLKLNVQNNEIEISKDINKSILNHHIDEIIYFFEENEFNIVIIEDLDRFKETEIFNKLREINHLLNLSASTKEKAIVFIYAVRDNIFSNKERTKFFDFIVPIVPIINSSNSTSFILDEMKLLEVEAIETSNKIEQSDTLLINIAKQKEQEKEDLITLIESISFFIDDMRLLQNIINEFKVYSKVLQKNNRPKLFALITYKNIFPKDFTSLEKNEGVLYSILNTKFTLRQKEIESLKGKRKVISTQIEEIENNNVDSIEELKLIYIMHIIMSSQPFVEFSLNNSPFPIDRLILDDNFDYLKNDSLRYKEHPSYSSINLKTTFETIEKQVHELTYQKREDIIKNKTANQLNNLKNIIESYDKEIAHIKTKKISQLLDFENNENFKNIDSKYINFYKILLKNEYIEDDYSSYISHFHPGQLSLNDNVFILNCQNQTLSPFEFKLNNLEKIISKIEIHFFKSKYILNYSVLEYLLSNELNINKRNEFFKKLIDESTESLDFITNFPNNTELESKFYQLLFEYWKNIWEYHSKFENHETLPPLLNKIIKYADSLDLLSISNGTNFKSMLEYSYLEHIAKIEEKDKRENIITDLELKFQNLNEGIDEETIKFLYDNNNYQINTQNIKKILKK